MKKKSDVTLNKISNGEEIAVMHGDEQIGVMSRELLEFFLRTDTMSVGSEIEYE